MTAFGDLLRTRLSEAGMSQMDLARQLDTSSSVISQTCSGVRLPPLARISAWARALGLSGARAEEFIAAAQLAHAPPQVREQFERLRGTAGDPAAPPAARRVREGDEEEAVQAAAAAFADCADQLDPARHPVIPPLDLAWVGRGVLDGLLQRLDRDWLPASSAAPLREARVRLVEAIAEFQATLRPSAPATVAPALRRLGQALAKARALLAPTADKGARRTR